MSLARARAAAARERDHVQAVEQILAEAALGHRRRESRLVAATTRTSTAIGCAAADAPHLALLQHAQELRPASRRHVADLVEEQRAAAASSKQPAPRARARR